MTALMPPSSLAGAQVAEGDSRSPAKRRIVRGAPTGTRRWSAAPRDRTPERIPEGRPGRGLRKFSGTSWGSSSASCAANSARCSSVSPMPRMPPQQTSMPARAPSQVSQRSSHEWVVTTGGSASARSRGCGCSGARPCRSARRPVLGEHPERGRDIDLDRGTDGCDALAHLCHEPLVRPAHGGHDAELVAPVAASRGRLPATGCPATPTARVRRTDRTGTEVAVLGAAAGLDRHDALDLDLGSAPAQRTSWARARSAARSSSGRRSTS